MNTRTECSPRIIKRINVKEKADDASKYDFYRQINHLSIMRLDNEADKMNYASWLTRLDTDTSDLKMHLIKILFISLRSDKSFQMFLKPPPDDLKDLELRSDNTMDMVKWLQDNNLADESLTNEEKKQEIKHRRSAAVATNMRSYTTIKTSPYFVQSFYVRSDWPIYTWYNPASIRLPSNFDHNQWELFLNNFQIVTEDKSAKSKHRNECDDIIPIDQVTKAIASSFKWHPYSILASEENRPKRTAGSIAMDLDVSNQQCNQQEIDDAAFAIVFCKLLPGNKTLSQKMYSKTLIPDAKFIFRMTGVTLVNYSNRKLVKSEKLPFTCEIKQRQRAVKNICGVKEKTPCPCEKPMMTIDCGKTDSSCPTTARKPKEIVQTKRPSADADESDNCKSGDPNPRRECKSNSKCLKRSVKKAKSVERCKFPEREADDDDGCDESGGERNRRSTVLNAGGSSFNDGSNCDWTVSFHSVASTGSRGRTDSAPIGSDRQVVRGEPEDRQSATRHCGCSGVQQQKRRTAATPPHQCPRTAAAEGVREPPREHRRGRRRSRGNRDASNAERTAGSGRGTGAGRRSASARSARSAASDDDDERRGVRRPCPVKDMQNRSGPVAFVPSSRVQPSFVFDAEHQPQQQQQQQQHEFAGPSGDNRSDTAWDPEVAGSYSTFSVAIRSRPSSPLPASDFHGDNDDPSDDCGSGETSRDWSAELQEIDRCQSWTRVMWTNNRFRDDDDHDSNDSNGSNGSNNSNNSNNDDHNNNNNYINNNNDYGDTAGSLCTFTSSSSDISIEIRRTDDLLQPPPTTATATSYDDDRYPFDGGLQREDALSVRGSSITTWPWLSSSCTSGSRSGPRVREFGDVRAPERYDGTSCSSSGGGNASAGRDDYRGGSETDDDGAGGGAGAAPLHRRRNY